MRVRILRWGVVGLVGVASVAVAAPRPPAPRPDPGTAPAVPTAVRRAAPAVVGLRAGVPPDRPSAGTLGTERQGSGVLIGPEGTLVTVGYLVLEATRVEAALPDGRTLRARVLGHDFDSGLALLRLEGGGPYPALALGRSEAAAPGLPGAIVGMTPEGDLVGRPATVTAVRPFVGYWEYRLDRALVVAPLHPAFGGAALVDPDGALLGVVSLRLEREHVAIPIDRLRPVQDDLIRYGRPARPPRPWLGVRVFPAPGGVLVGGVSPAGPARAAGLRPGDLVVQVEGQPVTDVGQLYDRLWGHPVGTELELTVVREGRLERVRVRPVDRYTIFRAP